MLFADDIDWTAVIKTTGASVVLVVGALGGWYLKIMSNRQGFEIKQRELEAATRAAEVEQKATQKAEEDERRDARERRDELAEQRREKNIIEELRRVLDISMSQHKEDREALLKVRGEMQVMSSRLEACELQRAQQTRQIAEQNKQLVMLFARLGMELPAPSDDGTVLTVKHKNISHLPKSGGGHE